jgi:acyl carrier protein
MAAAYDQVLAQTSALIARYVEDGMVVSAASRYDSDLNLDSIQVMDLVAEIEDHFDVTIPLNDLPRMQNVEQTARRLVELINARR